MRINRINFATVLGLQATQAAQSWAVECFNRVCGIGMSIVNSGGQISFSPRNSNDVAGRTQENQIQISTVRRFGSVEVLGGVIVHEICHAWGFNRAINWGHTPNSTAYLDRIMHPWVANDSWWHPAEVVSLQRRYGLPARPFRAWEVDALAKATSDAHQQYMRTKSPADLARSRELRAARDAKARLWMSVPMFSRSSVPWMPWNLLVDLEFAPIPEATPSGLYECQCGEGL